MRIRKPLKFTANMSRKVFKLMFEIWRTTTRAKSFGGFAFKTAYLNEVRPRKRKEKTEKKKRTKSRFAEKNIGSFCKKWSRWNNRHLRRKDKWRKCKSS